jgi:hypothetical protein
MGNENMGDKRISNELVSIIMKEEGTGGLMLK